MVNELIERGHYFIDVIGIMFTIGGSIIVGSISYLNTKITNMVNSYTNEVSILEQQFEDLQHSKADSDAILLNRINQIGDILNKLVTKDITKEFIEVFVTKDTFTQSLSMLQQNIDDIRRRCCDDKK